MKRIPFQILHDGDTLPEALSELAVSIEIAEEQPADGAVLTFALRLENPGDEAIDVRNPYDLLTYKLTNADGWPVAVEAPSSKTGKVHGAVGDHRGDYLAMVAASADGRPRDVEQERVAPTVTLPAGATYRATFAISRLAAPPNDPEGPTTIAPGAYGLKCQLLLLAADDVKPPGATLVTEPVTVTVR